MPPESRAECFSARTSGQRSTMAEKLRYCEEHLDDFRNLILHEPRGYPGLCSPIVVPATDPSCDFGMIVMEQGGFKPMSGSNLICTVTALIETGSVDVSEPVTELRVDTAAGIVTVRAEVEAGRAKIGDLRQCAGFRPRTRPAARGARVRDDPRRHRLRRSVLRPDCGGQPRRGSRSGQCQGDHPGGQRDAGRRRTRPSRYDIPSSRDRFDRSADDPRSRPYRRAPTDATRSSCPTASSTSTIRARGPGTLDRSPCGTGTSGRVAAKHARGELPSVSGSSTNR
jgi:proline racemase